MNKIFGITSTHGTGKSTLLNGLEFGGINVDKTKISRNVQNALGWSSLERVLESFNTMMDFQEEVFKQLVERDRKITVPTVVERTPLDLVTYSTLWFKHFRDKEMEVDEDRLLQYEIDCMEWFFENYGGVIYIPIVDAIPFEIESSRGFASNREEHDQLIQSIIKYSASIDKSMMVLYVADVNPDLRTLALLQTLPQIDNFYNINYVPNEDLKVQ